MHTTRSLADLRIVFMGTPEFAVASLKALLDAGANVVGVITAPDKPAGRGLQLSQSAVKKFAVERGLHLLQPDKLKDPGFISQLRELRADVQVVVAFRMLPEIVWNMPPMGTVNVHGSLLPDYRGAAPINWAIINGDETTGVTTFRLKHEIDTGDVLLQEAIPISNDDTAGEVHDRMKEVGAAVLVRTLEGLAAGTIHETPQDLSAAARHAPKLFTEHCRIDFTKSVDRVHNVVRGLSPFPGAFTTLHGKTLKIYKSSKQNGTTDVLPGTVMSDQRSFLKFACSDGYLLVHELQLEGKKKMKIDEFLRGYRFPADQ